MVSGLHFPAKSKKEQYSETIKTCLFVIYKHFFNHRLFRARLEENYCFGNVLGMILKILKCAVVKDLLVTN